jgi:hypothetical protein
MFHLCLITLNMSNLIDLPLLICISIYLYLYLSIYPSIHPSIYLSIFLYVCLSIQDEAEFRSWQVEIRFLNLFGFPACAIYLHGWNLNHRSVYFLKKFYNALRRGEIQIASLLCLCSGRLGFDLFLFFKNFERRPAFQRTRGSIGQILRRWDASWDSESGPTTQRGLRNQASAAINVMSSP